MHFWAVRKIGLWNRTDLIGAPSFNFGFTRGAIFAPIMSYREGYLRISHGAPTIYNAGRNSGRKAKLLGDR
jgi:hypothetical protein